MPSSLNSLKASSKDLSASPASRTSPQINGAGHSASASHAISNNVSKGVSSPQVRKDAHSQEKSDVAMLSESSSSDSSDNDDDSDNDSSSIDDDETKILESTLVNELELAEGKPVNGTTSPNTQSKAILSGSDDDSNSSASSSSSSDEDSDDVEAKKPNSSKGTPLGQPSPGSTGSNSQNLRSMPTFSTNNATTLSMPTFAGVSSFASQPLPESKGSIKPERMDTSGGSLHSNRLPATNVFSLPNEDLRLSESGSDSD